MPQSAPLFQLAYGPLNRGPFYVIALTSSWSLGGKKAHLGPANSFIAVELTKKLNNLAVQWQSY
jgi:hypothetical protein